MALNEITITEAIATSFFEKFKSCLEVDVAIVGSGPSGMTAARKLAEKGWNVAQFERKLSLGGGMWGGGMTWNTLVVQPESKHLLEEVGIQLSEFKEGYWVADAVACTTTLASKACLAGVKVFNCMTVEDVVVRDTEDGLRVTGLVVNSSPVEMAGLHVDPITISAKYVIEATGHDVEVLHKLVRKNGVKLNTPSGAIEGEKSLWADRAEQTTVNNTREIFPGMFVAGMAANASYGSYRMGPVFGGMLLSGEKVAEELDARLREEA